MNRASYLPKWLLLGATIGAIAGCGAIVFYEALRWSTRLFTGLLLGYTAPSPASEPAGALDTHVDHLWLLPLVIATGGLVSGFLVFRFAPEAEGHGTDAAIDAVHHNPRKIRSRAVLVKLVASAVTIGTGGSGGREGPTAQISAGFGSLLCRVFDLNPEDGRIAVSVGIGSGIGAIFGAPLGGAVTAADITYRDDFEPQALVPGFVASAVSYLIFGSVEGFRPLFGFVDASYSFGRPAELLWFVVIGILCGLFGLLYSTTFYGVIDLAARIPGSRIFKPAVGGLLVGLLALAVPQVIGAGYGWVQHSLDARQLLAMPLWIVLVLPIAKIVATSLSIGSGGSGGIFGPGIVIGAFLGAACWRLGHLAHLGVGHSPAPLVVVAMMACFGSIARAPLAMMLMVCEMTGTVAMLAPAMISVGIAYLIVHRSGATIYRSQLLDRTSSDPARLARGLPLLRDIPIRMAMSAPRVILHDTETAGAAAARLRRSGCPAAPVIDELGQFVGVFTDDGHAMTSGTSRAAERRSVDAFTDPAAPAIPDDVQLDVAAESFFDGASWLPVLDPARRVAGILTLADLARAYRRAAADATGSDLEGDSLQIGEITVTADRLGGSTVHDPSLSAAIVLAVTRDGAELPLAGTEVLRIGDVLTVLEPAGAPTRTA